MIKPEFYDLDSVVDDLDVIIATGASYEELCTVRNKIINIMIRMIKEPEPQHLAPTHRAVIGSDISDDLK